MRLKRSGLAIVLMILSALPWLAQAQALRSPTPASLDGAVRFETVAKGLEHPWGLAFLPDGRMLSPSALGA